MPLPIGTLAHDTDVSESNLGIEQTGTGGGEWLRLGVEIHYKRPLLPNFTRENPSPKLNSQATVLLKGVGIP